jgi:hypothetical protein
MTGSPSPEAVQQNDQRPVAGRRQCNRSRRPGRYGGLNNWAILVLVALAAADGLDTALRAADEILAAARRRGAALAVASTSAMRAYVALRGGDLIAAQADAQAAIDLAPDLLGAEFPLVLAVSAAVLAGLERDETPASLRRLIDRTGARLDVEREPCRQGALCELARG